MSLIPLLKLIISNLEDIYMAKECKIRGAHPQMVILGLHLDHNRTVGKINSPPFPQFMVFLLKLQTVCFFKMDSLISVQSSLVFAMSTEELVYGLFRKEEINVV